MTVVAFDEAIFSREGTQSVLTLDGSAQLTYFAKSNATDAATQELEVIAAAIDQSPSMYLTLARNAPRRRELGGGWWELVVPYSNRDAEQNKRDEPQPVGTMSRFSFSFAFRGVTQRIRQSIQVAAKTTAAPGTVGKSAPIGFDGERVNGADIIVPQATFSETHKFDVADVDDALKFAWLRLVGKTNDAPFRNAATGELLLTSVTGQHSGEEPWDITFEFLFSENITASFSIYPKGGGAPSDTNIAKGGHELLDFGYESAVIANEKINNLIWVQAHQVYRTGDYTTLEIPGT